MKKIIGILGVAVIAAAMFFSANAMSGSTTDTSLASLLTLNSANAECIRDPYNPELNTGHCYVLSGHCYWNGNGPDQECNPWAM